MVNTIKYIHLRGEVVCWHNNEQCVFLVTFTYVRSPYVKERDEGGVSGVMKMDIGDVTA